MVAAPEVGLEQRRGLPFEHAIDEDLEATRARRSLARLARFFTGHRVEGPPAERGAALGVGLGSLADSAVDELPWTPARTPSGLAQASTRTEQLSRGARLPDRWRSPPRSTPGSITAVMPKLAADRSACRSPARSVLGRRLAAIARRPAPPRSRAGCRWARRWRGRARSRRCVDPCRAVDAGDRERSRVDPRGVTVGALEEHRSIRNDGVEHRSVRVRAAGNSERSQPAPISHPWRVGCAAARRTRAPWPGSRRWSAPRPASTRGAHAARDRMDVRVVKPRQHHPRRRGR